MTLIGLTQVLAAGYGPQDIRLNAVLPGAVETATFEAATRPPFNREAARARLLKSMTRGNRLNSRFRRILGEQSLRKFEVTRQLLPIG